MIPPLPDPLLLPVVSGVELLCSCMQSLMDMVGYLLDTFTPQPVEDNLIHSVTVLFEGEKHVQQRIRSG